MSRPIFPPTIDSTMLAAFRSCPQKMFQQYVQHWKPKAESVHLIAGGAFAKGVEVARRAFYDGVVPMWGLSSKSREIIVDWRDDSSFIGNRDASEAQGIAALAKTYGNFQCPPDSGKSLERTMGALAFYFDAYPLGSCGATPLKVGDKNCIEFSFAKPIDVRHPVSGAPILYTGRADMIAEYAGGLYAVDEKTTSSLGASWSRQWEMRSQFTGYQWAAQEDLNVPVQGTIVRGVSILKTKYDTQQVVTYRAPFEVQRWYDQTCHDVERMIAMWQSGHWDYNLDHACSEYGGCSFLQVCKSPTPDEWLPMAFEQRVWDPLAREEYSVASWNEMWKELAAP